MLDTLAVTSLCKLPFDNEPPELLPIGFNVQKLFVGLSFTASPVTKLFGVKLLPLPLKSLPSVVAVVPELSEKFNLKPFVPYVTEGFLGIHWPVFAFVSPKDDGVKADPSIKLYSVKYPSK